MEYFSAFNLISVCSHHIKQTVCGSRARYRDGKKETAVKVYTVNQESVYILITNVPAVGGFEELQGLCDQYGIVEEFRPLDDYPSEEFTETYLAKYSSFPAARTAKKYLDDKSFFGGILHVFYAPEFETVHETRLKLQERRKYIAWKINKGQNSQTEKKTEAHQSNSNKTAGPNTIQKNIPIQPVTYVWAGKEYTVYPHTSTAEDTVTENKVKERTTSNVFVPRQLKQKSCVSNVNSIQSTSASNSNSSHIEESSYVNTISHIRNKISKVSVPNVRVSLKRRRRV